MRFGHASLLSQFSNRRIRLRTRGAICGTFDKGRSRLVVPSKARAPQAPKVKSQAGVRNPIDAFVLASLEAKGLKLSSPADKETLIRRVAFDLTGLPPTPEEIDHFLKDTSAEAYAKLVDHLLASSAYGEHWARHWLDVARFAESQGFEYDRIRDNAWRYRDYVIKSLNDDKPYAQFVKEQLAGDVVEPVTSEGTIATGFLVAGPFDQAGSGAASSLIRAKVREGSTRGYALRRRPDIFGSDYQLLAATTTNSIPFP